MRKIFLVCTLAFFMSIHLYSQNELGLKLGLTSYDLAQKEIGSTEELKLSIKDAGYGFQFGIYGRIGLLGLYVQPEILLNSNIVRYKLEDLDNLDTLAQIRSTKYQDLDIPVLIMISPGFFKIYAGPVGHYHYKKISEFTNRDKIKEALNNLTYGYQFGVGITFNSLTLDVRYESNFSNTFKTFIIDDKEFKIDESPARVIFSAWFAF